MSKFILSGFADEIDANLEKQLKGLNELGISYIEPRGINGKNVVEHTISEAKEAKKVMESYNIGVSAIGSPIGKMNIDEPFEGELDKFKHILELSKVFDTKYIRMFSFFMPKGEEIEKYRDEVMKRWGKYIESAKGFDVVLLHENERDIYGDTACRCRDLFDTLNCSYLKATFDPANFVVCGEDTIKAYELLEEYIEYVHIKDAVKAEDRVVPAGFGEGHIAEILDRLKARGYDGFLSLEPHLANFTGFEGLEKRRKEILNVEGEGGFRTFKIATMALRDILDKQ